VIPVLIPEVETLTPSMGKRKSSKKAPVKKRVQPKVPTIFDCPFCNHEKTVECQDRDKNIGLVRCRLCSEDFQVRINFLSEPIDVYSEWIDELHEVNKAVSVADARSSADV